MLYFFLKNLFRFDLKLFQVSFALDLCCLSFSVLVVDLFYHLATLLLSLHKPSCCLLATTISCSMPFCSTTPPRTSTPQTLSSLVGNPCHQIYLFNGAVDALSLVEGPEEPGHQQRPVLPASQLVHLLLFCASGAHLLSAGSRREQKV